MHTFSIKKWSIIQKFNNKWSVTQIFKGKVVGYRNFKQKWKGKEVEKVFGYFEFKHKSGRFHNFQ